VFRQKLLGEDSVPLSDPSWKSPQVTYTTPNKRVWKLPTSTQLRATWHTDSLELVVLSSTGVSRYHNCCIDGGTSPEYFGYHLVWGRYLTYSYRKYIVTTTKILHHNPNKIGPKNPNHAIYYNPHNLPHLLLSSSLNFNVCCIVNCNSQYF
jgi:hypothetical protein